MTRSFRPSPRTAAFLLAISGLLFSSERARAFDFFGFDEAAYSPEGRDGLREIFGGRMFNAAIPPGMIRARAATENKEMEALGFEPGSAEGRFHLQGTLPSPRAGDPSLFLGLSTFERDGKQMVGGDCFACHAGVVGGVVVAGLGSNSLVQNTPGLLSSRGDNYGQYAVWSFAARLLDPANTGLKTATGRTELLELIQSTPLPPVQPMPWWLMKYKVRDYWYGDGGPSDAAHFSLNFTVAHPQANENHAAHVAATGRALAFARETVSPPFPGRLDAALVRRGAELFHGRERPADPSSFRTCAQCHGEYSRKPSANDDLSTPGSWSVDYDGSEKLRDVGTDPEYNAVIRKFQPIVDHLAKLETYYEAQGTPELFPRDQPLPGEGYVPPPLVGVWASAPYFHNGSVPTIEAVLNSAARPKIWARDRSASAYDLASVGLVYTEVSREEQDALVARAAAEGGAAEVERRFHYDTEAFGRAASGHAFGDSLSPDERAAIVEFLKSLSGPDM